MTEFVKRQYRLLPWIDTDKLDMYVVSMEPKAISFLEKHPEKIDWNSIWINTPAIHIILENIDKKEVNWSLFAGNEADEVYPFIRDNFDKITDFSYFCRNRNPWINKIFEEFPHYIDRLNRKEMGCN